MKRWALVVVGLYAAALLAIVGPLIVIALGADAKVVASAYSVSTPWVWVLVMALCQWALLTIPVRVANRRPTARRSLILPVMVGGFLGALLLTGIVLCARALLWQDAPSHAWSRWVALALAGAAWSGWSLLFYRMGRSAKPEDVITVQCRALLRGSVLELLVAVPSHIVMRNRHVCCADIPTFIGIAFGISVMLLSFGPALFFLFANRWRRLHPRTESDPAAS